MLFSTVKYVNLPSKLRLVKVSGHHCIRLFDFAAKDRTYLCSVAYRH